ncbi:dolichyldiphosphatase [Emericellopsis cladophorae]|uniref:Dolichyldiphosphatase n=1 Tax=Emericellopsis cladophorae TaxID=2686198 RepID=A0A9P9Y3Y1_9HYPO|nr:dolichyldiphosphatase [Emericellopsis cladophorae]KAI6782926.1 dolichyldiphosphatase [Emericellopsis cladophorae]
MASYDTPLASLSISHVYYDPNDRISLVCAYLALLPQALCVVYATLILTTREAEILLTFAGQLACEALNFALKRLIKEERPPRISGKGYGMPSSHAQFVAFWSVSVTLFLLVRHNPPKVMGKVASSTHRPWSVAERGLVSLAGLIMAALVAWSRVYLGYHTGRQVVVGCGAGAGSAVVWFVFVGLLRSGGWLKWALAHPLARRARARDLIMEEDMVQAGWEKWDARQQAELKASGEKKGR